MKQPKPRNPALETETTESRAVAAVRVATVAERHDLGAGRSVGDYLRQSVTVRGQVAAWRVWGPACSALKERDRGIGGSAKQRVERRKLRVQNRRFVVVGEKGRSPNLASQARGAALGAVATQRQDHFGYRLRLAESFTDAEAYAGRCYKASNWEPVGFGAGSARRRADFHIPAERPQRLGLRALDARARRHRDAVTVPAGCVGGVIAPPGGVVPLSRPQLLALKEVFRRAPDPRAKNTRFRIGPVLTLIALALLAGRRDMIRDDLGLLTLAQHEDGAPQAVAIYDQEDGTARCEQSASTALLTGLPVLDDKIVTADALHGQKTTARTIAEQGGDYLLPIKGNQPKLLAQAEAPNARASPPFFSPPIPATAASSPEASTPSRSNRSPRPSPPPAP